MLQIGCAYKCTWCMNTDESKNLYEEKAAKLLFFSNLHLSVCTFCESILDPIHFNV